MTPRFAFLAALLVVLAPASAQEPPSAPAPATVEVTLQTSLGPITLALETERAPVTAGNFLAYVDQKRLDGATFYRATKIGDAYGLIQGGANSDPKRVLPPIAHEPTSETGLSHVDGAISMARLAPGSAQGEFFITIGDLVSMDAQPSAPGDNLGFAVFGRVVSGMDTVHRILSAPTDPDKGEGVMRGQMIAEPVTIVSARRAE